MNAFQAAAVIASGFFGMFVGAIALSIVSDYFGRRTLYLIDLLIYSLFSLATAFAPNVTWVIVFRFLAGIGLGATPALTDVYLSEMLPSRVRGRYTAWAYTFGLLGVPIAGLLSKVLVSTTFLIAGWRWLLVVGALGALIVRWMRRGLPESPRWFEIRQKTTWLSDLSESAGRPDVDRTGSSLGGGFDLYSLAESRLSTWRAFWMRSHVAVWAGLSRGT